MIRSPAPETIGETEPGDLVEVHERQLGVVAVAVAWKLPGGDAMVRLYGETTGMFLSRGVSQHLLIPNHVEVIRVIDPDAARMERERGEAHGEQRDEGQERDA